MKISTLILLVTFVLSISGMFASNLLLKREFDKLDKSDNYWNYGKILDQPFKHLKVEGGNISHIAFEPSARPSVKVFKNWAGYENKLVKAFVSNDTLYLRFPTNISNPQERKYLQWNTMVRIFSPQLMSVTGHDTQVELIKLKQKNLHIALSGKSVLEVESYLTHFDSLYIRQRDSSRVVFSISPDLKDRPIRHFDHGPGAPGVKKTTTGGTESQQTTGDRETSAGSRETIYVKAVNAQVQGASLLDIGRAQVTSLELDIADTSGIILSGNSLRKLKR